MVLGGLLLLLLGFALLVPRGSAPGSIAARNVAVGTSHIDRTPGYQEAPTGRAAWKRVAIGLGLLAIGVLLLVLGL